MLLRIMGDKHFARIVKIIGSLQAQEENYK